MKASPEYALPLLLLTLHITLPFGSYKACCILLLLLLLTWRLVSRVGLTGLSTGLFYCHSAQECGCRCC